MAPTTIGGWIQVPSPRCFRQALQSDKQGQVRTRDSAPSPGLILVPVFQSTISADIPNPGSTSLALPDIYDFVKYSPIPRDP